jgi:hypothetical protein
VARRGRRGPLARARVRDPEDFREQPVDDADFPASVRAYEEAPPGASVHVPISPRPWAIDLVKPAAAR